MWTTIESMIITLAITMLKSLTKSASASAEESKIIAQVALAATQADMIANGNVWSVSPAVAPAATK